MKRTIMKVAALLLSFSLLCGCGSDKGGKKDKADSGAKDSTSVVTSTEKSQADDSDATKTDDVSEGALNVGSGNAANSEGDVFSHAYLSWESKPFDRIVGDYAIEYGDGMNTIFGALSISPASDDTYKAILQLGTIYKEYKIKETSEYLSKYEDQYSYKTNAEAFDCGEDEFSFYWEYDKFETSEQLYGHFDLYDGGSDNYISGHMYSFDNLYAMAPDDYQDEDIYGLITEELKDPKLAPWTDDYMVIYSGTSVGESYVSLMCFDQNGIAVKSRIKYVYSSAADAQRQAGYYKGLDEYEDIETVGNVFYATARRVEAKSEQYKVNPFVMRAGTHYAFNSLDGPGETSYYMYSSKPIDFGYEPAADDFAVWGQAAGKLFYENVSDGIVEDGYYVTLSTNNTTYYDEIYLSHYNPYGATETEHPNQSYRIDKNVYTSVGYILGIDDPEAAGIYFTEYVLERGTIKITDYVIKDVDFDNVDVTFDNYKEKATIYGNHVISLDNCKHSEDRSNTPDYRFLSNSSSTCTGKTKDKPMQYGLEREWWEGTFSLRAIRFEGIEETEVDGEVSFATNEDGTISMNCSLDGITYSRIFVEDYFGVYFDEDGVSYDAKISGGQDEEGTNYSFNLYCYPNSGIMYSFGLYNFSWSTTYAITEINKIK